MKALRFVSMLTLIFAAVSIPLQAASDTDLRKEMTEASRRELLNLGRAEVSGTSLGEWKDIIDSSLFILFRRTELFRGQMRVLVINNQAVTVKMYPDGTFVLSTGLLDYIDASLFESAADSPRRMRNFDTERESVLVPFLVSEAAHFALDHNFAAYKRNVASSSAMISDARITASLVASAEETLAADRFSILLLSLAGFDPTVFDSHLQTLQTLAKAASATQSQSPNQNPDTSFLAYLADLPSAETRIDSLTASRDTLPKIIAEFSGVLASLKTGTALDDARSSLIALADIYPDSPYLSRLNALVLHRQWLATVPAEIQKLKTLLPIADEEDPSRPQFIALLNAKSPKFPSPAEMDKQTAIPGNAEIFINALDSYNAALAAYNDSSLSSSRAMLQIWSGNAASRKIAMQSAADAAASENGSDCVTARANYASILFLTGTDYGRAQTLLAGIESGDVSGTGTTGNSPTKKHSVLLDQGFPGDGRDIILNEVLMLRALGDAERTKAKTATLDALMPKKAETGTLALRFIHAGDIIDELVTKWGRPTEIIYNYFTENWEYTSLSASILVSGTDAPLKTQTIKLIRLGLRSPISPGGDIRTGDTRPQFEAVFGKPSYRSGDCAVYFKDGNRLTVLYLADKVRSITVGL